MLKPFRPIYRLLQRVMVLEAVAVLVARASEVAAARSAMTDADVRVLAAAEVRRSIARGEAPYCEPLVDRLADPRLTCVGAVADKRLLSFAWFHQGVAEAGMNYGRTPATATRIELAPDAAFVFHAYTSPEARGRGLMRAVLGIGAEWLLAQRGVTGLVTTTEVVNDAALAAFRGAGFKDAGTYWRFGLGGKVLGCYPRPVTPIVAYRGA